MVFDRNSLSAQGQSAFLRDGHPTARAEAINAKERHVGISIEESDSRESISGNLATRSITIRSGVCEMFARERLRVPVSHVEVAEVVGRGGGGVQPISAFIVPSEDTFAGPLEATAETRTEDRIPPRFPLHPPRRRKRPLGVNWCSCAAGRRSGEIHRCRASGASGPPRDVPSELRAAEDMTAVSAS
jgi:hypothetical protein